MENQKFNRLESKFEKLAYIYGYEIATGDRGTGWMAYSKGDFEKEYETPFPKQDPLNDEDLLSFVEGWQETDQYQYEMRDLFDKVRKFRDDEDWIHLYTAIKTEFETGFLEAMIEIESQTKKKAS